MNEPSGKIDSPTAERNKLLRRLPSVQTLLSDGEIGVSQSSIARDTLVELARMAIESVRSAIEVGHSGDDPVAEVRERFLTSLRDLNRPRLREVINATGVIVHTNLGRAPVSRATAEAMSLVASRYTPLELEIESGKRGGRMSEISAMLRLLTGAEASLVVNNNAAAVLLVLSALCAGRDVILSRSQAVEIGGGFRIPDVLAQSGARLVEVGTTNRTYARDYEAAIGDETAALLAVHWSNFRIIGFTKQPTLAELSELAKRRSVSLIEDLGSGSLLETTPYGLAPEPTVGESVRAGVDIVCFSGDKLLGGPQAGIISGRRILIERISRHPLARAVRADKTALAGIAATLTHYIRDEATEQIPVWQMISTSGELLRYRCEQLLERISSPANVRIVETESAIGGGSLPGEVLPSFGLAIEPARGFDVEELARRLRTGSPPIMAHITDDLLILDLRTVMPEQDGLLVRALQRLHGPDAC